MKRQLALIPFIVLLVGCSSTGILPGNDPNVVAAEKAISTAQATFDLVEKTEYDVYPGLKAANPTVAAEIRTFVNNLRANQKQWLQSATDLKNSYKSNRTPENKANMDTAIAVITEATAQSVKYIALMAQTHAWLSYQLADHIGERK